MKQVTFSVGIAFVLWTLMFSPWTAPHLNFWWAMATSALLLMTWVAATCRDTFRLLRFAPTDIALGIAVAAALWAVFYAGDALSSAILPFARPQVDGIYAMKDGQSPVLLSALLLLVIGPAEEIFWRGYVQRTLARRTNPNRAFIVTTLVYTLVHIASFNFMLIMAAMVCGIAWGGLYRLFPRRFGAIVLSHALWDALVFIWFPI